MSCQGKFRIPWMNTLCAFPYESEIRIEQQTFRITLRLGHLLDTASDTDFRALGRSRYGQCDLFISTSARCIPLKGTIIGLLMLLVKFVGKL